MSTYINPNAIADNSITKNKLGIGNDELSAYPLVNHGTNDTTFTLTPNTFHVWGTVSSLTLTFGDTLNDIINEYTFQFTSNANTTLILPNVIKWANDMVPTIVENKTYVVSVINNLAVFTEF